MQLSLASFLVVFADFGGIKFLEFFIFFYLCNSLQMSA